MQDDFKEYMILKNGDVYEDRYDDERICIEDCDELKKKYPNEQWEYREMTTEEVYHYINDFL